MKQYDFDKMVDQLLYLGVPLQRNFYSIKPSIYGTLIPIQTLVLNTLYKKGVMGLSELAKYLGKSSQRLNKPLQDLEERGLVKKMKDQLNKKIVKFEITKAGADMEKRAVAHIHNNCRIKFSVLSDEELSRLCLAADTIITIMDKLDGQNDV